VHVKAETATQNSISIPSFAYPIASGGLLTLYTLCNRSQSALKPVRNTAVLEINKPDSWM